MIEPTYFEYNDHLHDAAVGGHDEEKERILAANAAARAAAATNGGTGAIGHGSLQMASVRRPQPSTANRGKQRPSQPAINPTAVSGTSSHEPNISYADPIDEALHTSYQWTKPGFSIDHVCFKSLVFLNKILPSRFFFSWLPSVGIKSTDTRQNKAQQIENENN